MSETKQETWSWSESEYGHSIHIGGDHIVWEHCVYPTDGDGSQYAETEAKVRLIAAAPDLLAACKAAYEMFGDGGDTEHVIRMVEAAISKAEGTPNA